MQYLISNTLNNKVSPDKLKSEINQSPITIKLLSVTSDGTNINIKH